MKIKITNFFLLLFIVNILYVSVSNSESNFELEKQLNLKLLKLNDLLKPEASCLLECVSIPGYEKEEKICHKLNSDLKSFYEFIVDGKRESFDKYKDIAQLWNDCNKDNAIFNLFGLTSKGIESSFKKYIDILKSKNPENAFAVEKLNLYFFNKYIELELLPPSYRC